MMVRVFLFKRQGRNMDCMVMDPKSSEASQVTGSQASSGKGVLSWLLIAIFSSLLVHHRFFTRCDYEYGDDDLEYHIPYAAFLLDSLETGQSPLWNPYTDLGAPIWTSTPFMGPFYPGVLLYYLFKPCAALNIGYLLHVLAACLGMFLLARRLALSPPASTLASVVYCGSSYFLALGNQGYLSDLISSSYLPWMTFALVWAFDSRSSLRPCLIAGLPLALALAGGNTVRTAMVATVAAVFFFILEPSLRSLVRKASVLTVVTISALASSAVLVLPMLLDIGTGRSDPRGFGLIRQEYSNPIILLRFFSPAYEPGTFASPFLGMISLLLLVIQTARFKDHLVRSSLAAAGICAIIAFGPGLGIHELLNTLLPPLSLFRYPYIFRLGIVFGFALASSRALDMLASSTATRKKNSPVLVRIVISGVAMSVLALLSYRFGSGHAHYVRLAADLVWIGSCAAVLCLLLFFSTHSNMDENVRRTPWFTQAIALAGTAELVLYSFLATEPAGKDFSPASYYRGGWIEAAVKGLEERKQKIDSPCAKRLLAFQVRTPEEKWDWRRNESMLRRFPAANSEVKIVSPGLLLAGRHLNAVSFFRNDIFTAAQGGPDPLGLRQGPLDLAPDTVDSRFLNLADVGYVLVDRGRKVTGDGSRLLARGRSSDLWERPTALSHARLVHGCIEAEGDATGLSLSGGIDLADNLVLEAGRCPHKGNNELETGESDVLTVECYNTKEVYRVRTEVPSYLVVSRSYHPGWKVFVDGKETSLYKAYGFLQAALIPEGEHIVTMSFEPAGFTMGAWISCTWLVVLFIVSAISIGKAPLP